MSKIDLINPGTWRFLAGGNSSLSPQVSAQRVKDAGYNGVYSPNIFIDAWGNSASVGYDYPNMTQTQ